MPREAGLLLLGLGRHQGLLLDSRPLGVVQRIRRSMVPSQFPLPVLTREAFLHLSRELLPFRLLAPSLPAQLELPVCLVQVRSRELRGLVPR